MGKDIIEGIVSLAHTARPMPPATASAGVMILQGIKKERMAVIGHPRFIYNL